MTLGQSKMPEEDFSCNNNYVFLLSFFPLTAIFILGVTGRTLGQTPAANGQSQSIPLSESLAHPGSYVSRYLGAALKVSWSHYYQNISQALSSLEFEPGTLSDWATTAPNFAILLIIFKIKNSTKTHCIISKCRWVTEILVARFSYILHDRTKR